MAKPPAKRIEKGRHRAALFLFSHRASFQLSKTSDSRFCKSLTARNLIILLALPARNLSSCKCIYLSLLTFLAPESGNVITSAGKECLRLAAAESFLLLNLLRQAGKAES